MPARLKFASFLAMSAIMAPIAWAQSAQAASNLPPAAQRLADPEAAHRQGLLQLQAHDLEAAVASFSSAISQAPTADTFKYRARAYAAQGKTGLALADINSALKLAPTDRALHRQQAQLAAQISPAPRRFAASPQQPLSDHYAAAANMASGVRNNLEAALNAGPRFSPSGSGAVYASGGAYDSGGRDDPLASAIRSRMDAAVQAQLAELVPQNQ